MDIKLLIAISSVVHMRMCICRIIILSELGVKGALIIMVGHGLCSSGLFYLANVVYERTSRRRLLISKGLLNLIPRMCLWWFLLIRRNMAAPPSLNLAREVLMLICLICWDYRLLIRVGLISFFSVAYGLYLFSLRQHGSFTESNRFMNSGYMVEFLVRLLHWLPVNLIVLCTWFFIYPDSLNKISYCGYEDALAQSIETRIKYL